MLAKANATEGAWADLASHALLSYRKTNNEVHRLLRVLLRSEAAPPAVMHADHFVYFPAIDAHALGPPTTALAATLPDLALSASGESVLVRV